VSAESRRYINLPNRGAGLPFSDGVLVGNTLYISGRIGLDPATGAAPASIDAELELLFTGFRDVLREGGMAMDDLVWVQVYFFMATIQRGLHQVVLARFAGSRLSRLGTTVNEWTF
jgi:enamine deaminase RidA (YjgF/YER057c/UK114 family)